MSHADPALRWLEAQGPPQWQMVLESLTGESLHAQAAGRVQAPEPDAWKYAVSLGGLEGTKLFAAGSSTSWRQVAELIVGDLESEYEATALEAAQQLLGGLARTLGALAKRESSPGATTRVDTTDSALWLDIRAKVKDHDILIAVGLDSRLLPLFEPPAEPPKPSAERSNLSANLEVLLDVELPITISFGRAKLPLKDLLKLSSGAIVELNRSVSEPVEVIVNDCVVARGEVVVVEGNYGVRVTQIVSRQERLKTIR